MTVKKILAFICSICPFCILKRLFPHSAYGKTMTKMERGCPACKAYNELHPAD